MNATPRKIYKIWRPIRYSMIGGGAVLVAYAIAAVFTTYPAPAIAYAGLFVLLFAPGVLIMLHALRSQIIVSPAGLEYHSLFYKVAAAWDDTERIARNRRKRYVLYLKKSGYEGPGWLGLVLRGTGRDRSVTLSLHIPNYRIGDFATDLKRYAPHLLEAQDQNRDAGADNELEIY